VSVSLYRGSVRRKAATYTEQHEYRINAETSIPRVEFEPTTTVFERAKTVHALDRAVSVIGNASTYIRLFYETKIFLHLSSVLENTGQPLGLNLGTVGWDEGVENGE
jgi:hypothetical protein